MSFRTPLAHLVRTARTARISRPPQPTLRSAFRRYASSTPGGPSDSVAQQVHAAQQRMYAERMKKNRTILIYVVGSLAIVTGVTYAAVPMYRAFCAATGFAGTPMTDPTRFAPERLYATDHSKGRPITVRFEATSSDTLPWSFEPVQRTVKVVPGETALAFYTAKNHSDKDLIGIATYNMTPDKIAPYFAKVECFCFEEQKIRAGEEVDLPVFFFIDRDVVDDPGMDGIDDIVLSYTFFRARRNDRGQAVFDAPEADVQKAGGFDKYEHAPPVGERS